MDGSYLDITPFLHIPISEIKFHSSRSSGPGGQNVNKLETRVELRFDVVHSRSLDEHSRSKIFQKLESLISSGGVLQIVVQESRSQWMNKQRALEKLTLLLRSALKKGKKRIQTKPTFSSHQTRLQSKRKKGEVKRLRKRLEDKSGE
jgi:ribosome-associated protein